jgi:hypothetical protein
MQLKLTRSQRQGGIVSKSIIFCLDARVQLTRDEQANVYRYKLGTQVIYNSEASKRHLAKSEAAQAMGTVGGAALGFVSLAMAAISLNITIDDLQRGRHIECKSLDELLGTEEAIMEACRRLRFYLDTAATFDGRDVLVDFSDVEPAVVSTAPPPMLAAPSVQTVPPPPQPAYKAPESDESASRTPPQPDAVPLSQYLASTPSADSPFDDMLIRAKRSWQSASSAQQVLMIAVTIIVLALLPKACS